MKYKNGLEIIFPIILNGSGSSGIKIRNVKFNRVKIEQFLSSSLSKYT